MPAIRRLLALRSWWVYQGIIPPERIEPVTAALLVGCCAHHIETHPNPEARERFRIGREQAAALLPDTLVQMNLVDDEAWPLALAR